MVCEAMRAPVRCYVYKNKEYSQTLRRNVCHRRHLCCRWFGAGVRTFVRDRKSIYILQTSGPADRL